jgi:hypothetical protein
MYEWEERLVLIMVCLKRTQLARQSRKRAVGFRGSLQVHLLVAEVRRHGDCACEGECVLARRAKGESPLVVESVRLLRRLHCPAAAHIGRRRS